jgi:hypothetical protein
MLSGFAGGEPGNITIGMPVEVTFDDVTPEISMPVFRAAAG